MFPIQSNFVSLLIKTLAAKDTSKFSNVITMDVISGSGSGTTSLITFAFTQMRGPMFAHLKIVNLVLLSEQILINM